MNRSIKSLMLLAVLSLGMNNVCAQDDAQNATMHWIMQRLTARIDSLYGPSMLFTHSGIRSRRTGRPDLENENFLRYFKEMYGIYRSVVPQGDASSELALKTLFKLRMKERLQELCELKKQQKRQWFPINCFDMMPVKLYLLKLDKLDQAYAYAFPGEQKLSDQVKVSLGYASASFR